MSPSKKKKFKTEKKIGKNPKTERCDQKPIFIQQRICAFEIKKNSFKKYFSELWFGPQLFFCFDIMYTVKPNDNVFIFTDGSNHDDFFTIMMAIKTIKNLKGIILGGGLFGHPGASLTIYTNLLTMFNRPSVKVYVGNFNSLEDQETNYGDIFAKQVKPKTLFWIDQLFGASYLIPNYGPNVVNFDFESDILATPDPIFFCLGGATSMINVADHAKFIYVMGGRFNPQDGSCIEPTSNVKKNPNASSNIYGDPLAAQKVLEIAGNKTAWLFSNAAQSITVDEETLKKLEDITHEGNEASLEIITTMYKTMMEVGEAYPASDASLYVLAFYPELFQSIVEDAIKIVTGVTLDIEVDCEERKIKDILTFEMGIGGMELDENGTKTFLVNDPIPDKVLQVFLDVMALDDCTFSERCCQCECDCQ